MYCLGLNSKVRNENGVEILELIVNWTLYFSKNVKVKIKYAFLLENVKPNLFYLYPCTNKFGYGYTTSNTLINNISTY